MSSGAGWGDITGGGRNAWGRTHLNQPAGGWYAGVAASSTGRRQPEMPYAEARRLVIAAGRGLAGVWNVLLVRKDVSPEP